MQLQGLGTEPTMFLQAAESLVGFLSACSGGPTTPSPAHKAQHFSYLHTFNNTFTADWQMWKGSQIYRVCLHRRECIFQTIVLKHVLNWTSNWTLKAATCNPPTRFAVGHCVSWATPPTSALPYHLSLSENKALQSATHNVATLWHIPSTQKVSYNVISL